MNFKFNIVEVDFIYQNHEFSIKIWTRFCQDTIVKIIEIALE